MGDTTVLENYRKSLIQHSERSERRLRFEQTKVYQKCPKWSFLASFWIYYAGGQNSVTRQVNFNLTKIDGKCQKFKSDILGNFPTLCSTFVLFLTFLLKNRQQNISSIMSQFALF